MATLTARKGETILIDDDKLDIVSPYKWHVYKGYAEASTKINGRVTTIRMHRLVMGLGHKVGIVDHINRNTLDNRVQNLRVVSAQENRMNTGPSRGNKSGYKGVVYRATNKLRPYVAFAHHNSKQYYLGAFKTAKDAADAYDKKIVELHGPLAYTNKKERIAI